MGAILAVNAGSSSLKLALFDADSLDELARESFDFGGDDDDAVRSAAVRGIGAWAQRSGAGRKLRAAGHRVVHGGARYAEPVVVDEAVYGNLELLVALAPLHQHHSLAPIRTLSESHPSLVQVACFDTAFHRGRPSAVERYGLPDSMYRDGIRRYGFHGLSYEYVLSELQRLDPALADGRIVIAHLGSGASLCAIRGGRSVDTTMGFTALDGLVMATRPGALDPGVVLHLLRDGSRDVADVEELLYRESGLRGVSGIGGDLRELEASDAPAAREAIETFVVGIVRAMGSMLAMLGGIDGLVFTGGIGEHSAQVRRQVAEHFQWLGVQLDEAANAANAASISAPESRVDVRVIATDEERRIALHVSETLRAA
jgi:acetate kinase